MELRWVLLPADDALSSGSSQTLFSEHQLQLNDTRLNSLGYTSEGETNQERRGSPHLSGGLITGEHDGSGRLI